MGAVSETGRQVAGFHGLDPARLLEGRAWSAGVEAALASGLSADEVVRMLTTRSLGAAANPYGLLIRDLRRLPTTRRPSAGFSEAERCARDLQAARRLGAAMATITDWDEAAVREQAAAYWPMNDTAQRAAVAVWREQARRLEPASGPGDPSSVEAGRAGLALARQALGGRARGRCL